MYTTAETKLFGIFGYPVGHVMSPRLQSLLADKTNKDIAYVAFSASPEEFASKFEAAKLLASGFNITVPHKLRVMDHLDIIDDGAKTIGAVNTVVKKDGKWYGYNTDGPGFLKSLNVNKIDVNGKNILMLGAGGAARGVACTLASNGAKSITITARTQEKADAIGEIIKTNTNAEYSGEFRRDSVYDIIINATPLGMQPNENENPFDSYDIVTKNTVCCDLIYSPWETLFLKEAKMRGAKTINGFGMLCYQGILAFEHFTGEKFPNSFYEEIYELFLNEFRK
ncbi:MAG: shikimate dehydrogenase [Ruminococcaceae bacterium]|nr:shikimate dehydrogenase [Oscillospiraceae bacterium]